MKQAVIAVSIGAKNPDKHFLVFKEKVPEEILNYLKLVDDNAYQSTERDQSNTGYIHNLSQNDSLNFLQMIGYQVRIVGFEITIENIDIWWPGDGHQCNFEYIWNLK